MQEYKTSWREKICFGVGAIGLDLSYGMFYSIFKLLFIKRTWS